MKKYSIIFAVCFLLVQDYLQAQPLYFKNYQVSNGLSNNTINCILQDKQGFLWFGSRNGLNRFDGKNFKVFRYRKSDAGSIGSSSVHSLCEDSKGNLWAGTAKGAYIYNSMQERFSLFDKIPAGEVRYIKAAGNDLWMILILHFTGMIHIKMLLTTGKPNHLL